MGIRRGHLSRRSQRAYRRGRGRCPLLGDDATVASIAGGTLFLAGIAIAGRAIGRYPQYRRLTSADSTTVRGCDVGDTVALTGTIDSDGELVAPCTETSCVAYDARIETQARNLQRSITFWIVDDRRTESHPFVLDDETGTVTVESSDARVRMPLSPVSSAETTTLLLRRVLEGASVDPDGPSSRYTEGTLKAGDPVSVVGRVADGRSLEETRSQRVVEAESVSVGLTGERVLRSTVRRDGPLGLGLVLGGVALMLAAAGFL
ncbi:hypothetical protein E2L06_08655 [Haloterrigena sp. H1]|nr:hypothetical protein E2L06_08655 [Haloterrigena sp. H1]